MHVMDLVLQGVRRFEESRKFPLKPGFNVIFGVEQAGKTTMLECLLSLFFADKLAAMDSTLVSSGGQAASRAGLTLGSGGDVYRILKDFRGGKISLTQFNRASQKFEPLASDPAQVAANLAETFGMPSYEIYRELFVSSVTRMPSQAQKAARDKKNAANAPNNPAMQPPGMPGMQPPGMMPPGTMPPGMQQPGMMPPGTMPPGAMPPGMMPPGTMPPGAVPPGMMPPGAMPPGAMPPGAMHPGMMGATMHGGQMPGAMDPDMDDDMTPEERERKLVELREEYKLASKVEDIQYEIDGIQQKVFDIEAKKKSAYQYDEFLDGAKEQLSRYPCFHRLPEKIDERLEKYDDLKVVQGQEVEKIDAKARVHDDELYVLDAFPVYYKQKLTMAGAGLLVGGIVMFFLAATIPLFKTLGPVAAIAGLVMLAVTGFQEISRMGKKAEIQSKLDELDEQRQTVVKRFEVEMAVIEKILKDSDSDDLDELKNKLDKFRDLNARYQQINERKKKLVKDLKIDELEAKEKKLKAQIEELENELRKYPAASMGLGEMEREIKRLEKVIRMVNPDSPALKAAKESPADEGGAGVPDLDGAGVPDLGGADEDSDSGGGEAGILLEIACFERLIMSGAELFAIERNQIVKHVSERFTLYIQALFGKRYSKARIDVDNSVALKDAGSNTWVDFDQLSPAARDTAFLALQITILELAIQKRIIPIILDNPMVNLDETSQIVAGKALKRISERTQVILLSSGRAPAKFAEHSLNLG